MELFDRLLIIALALLFLCVGCLIHLDKRNRQLDSRAIKLKINTTISLLNDVIEISKDLQVKEILRDQLLIEINTDADNQDKKSVILEALEVKESIIFECLNEAISTLKEAIRELK